VTVDAKAVSILNSLIFCLDSIFICFVFSLEMSLTLSGSEEAQP